MARKRYSPDGIIAKLREADVALADRLTRSLMDFAKMVELFDKHRVSFVSVTQQFNTTSSIGRLTLNVLLSFAQFEREVTAERIRDKRAASRKKGLWMGGSVPIGYMISKTKGSFPIDKNRLHCGRSSNFILRSALSGPSSVN